MALLQQRSLTNIRCLQPVPASNNVKYLPFQRHPRLATTHRYVARASVQAELKHDAPRSSAIAQPEEVAAPTTQVDIGDFKWLEYWYPVHVLQCVDSNKPHAVELLGKQLVLWRDGQGKWQCMEDACPHRLAPLSEGRIEADGTLQCSYHGWRFDSQGRCTEIPQALDDKAKAVACNSSRSCVTTYPVREEYGLIWVWPTPGPQAEVLAAAQPTPLSKGTVAAFEEGRAGGWYRRELPYSWDVLVENLTDPSHLPFSHHNLTPNLRREKGAIPMPFQVVDIPTGTTPEDAAARPVYCMGHKAPLATFSFPSAMSPAGNVCFTPPLNVNYEYEFGPGVRLQNDLIAVPAGPGRSVAYTIGQSNAAKVTVMDIVKAVFSNPKMASVLAFRYAFQNQPRHQAHLQMNKLFDQDSVFLNMQDRQLALRGKSSWVQDYYMPAPCDGLVIAGRRWAEKALQLPLDHNTGKAAADAPTAASVISLSSEAAAAPRQPQRQLLDRHKQHTQHCMVCQKALQQLQQKMAAAKAASTVFTAAAVGFLAGALLPQLLQLFSNSATAAIASTELGPVAGVAIGAVLGACAWLARVIAAAAEKQVAQFSYVEFSHATNH